MKEVLRLGNKVYWGGAKFRREILGISVASFYEWKKRNQLPPPALRLGRHDYWDKATLNTFYLTGEPGDDAIELK